MRVRVIKGSVFFPGISLGVTHSPEIKKSVFSEKVENKKNKCFLFFPGIVCEPLTQNFLRRCIFLKENHVRLVFFPPFFSSLEKFTFTHSLD